MRWYIIAIGSSTIIGAYLILLVTFYNAVQSPSMETIVDINHYGEGWWEVVYLLLSLPIVAYYIFHTLPTQLKEAE